MAGTVKKGKKSQKPKEFAVGSPRPYGSVKKIYDSYRHLPIVTDSYELLNQLCWLHHFKPVIGFCIFAINGR